MNFKHLWLEAHSNEVHPENPKLEEKGKGLRKWHPNTQIIEEKAQRKGFLPLPSGIFDPNTSWDASKRRPKSNASTNQNQIRNTWTNKSSRRSQHTHTYDLLQKKLQRSEDPDKWKWKEERTVIQICRDLRWRTHLERDLSCAAAGKRKA